MKTELQRIAILEHLGWTELSRTGRRGDNGPMGALRGTTPEGVKGMIAPNPLTNLNVIREIEKTLKREQFAAYLDALDVACGGELELSAMVEGADLGFGFVHASASQKTEALSMILGLKEEETI